MLWSINERMAGREGMDVPPLTDDWIADLTTLEVLEAQYRKEAEEKAGNKAGDGWGWDDE